MDGNNRRAAQGNAPAAGAMDTADWRTQLQPDSRQRIVNKIMENIKGRLPVSGHEGAQELNKIAMRFEDMIHTAATSKQDYLQRFSKMLTKLTKFQYPDSIQPNAITSGQNAHGPGSHSMHSQVNSQAQQLPVPMVANETQTKQPLLLQNIQNNMASQNCVSLSPALPPVGNLTQATMPNVVGQNSNFQTMPNVGQVVPPDLVSNSQRQMQGRQQQVASQQQQQQFQTTQQFYQQQLHRQMMKKKFQQGNTPQSLIQHEQQKQQPQSQEEQQQQRQNLLQPTQRNQQQFGSQSNIAGIQQQQLTESQPVNSGLSCNRHPIHILQLSKIPVQRQTLQSAATVLPSQHQQSQSHPVQQQMTSQSQSRPPLGLQQQKNQLPREMQQSIQVSSPLLQHQKELYQLQRATPEASSTSLDSTVLRGNAIGADWQEEVYQKIKFMKEMYLSKLNYLYQKIASKMQQLDSLPQRPQNEQIETFKMLKITLGHILLFLRLNKQDIKLFHKEKLLQVEKHIGLFLSSDRPRTPTLSLQQGQLPEALRMQLKVQSSMEAMQQNNLTKLQHNSFSPQVTQHPSPQTDEQNMLASLTKAGPPLQSANSPFVVPSPSTSWDLSPMPGDSEKVSTGLASHIAAGNITHQQADAPDQSVGIGIPEISASPLLAEFTCLDGTHANVSAVVSGKSSVEQSLERLMKVVKNMSPKALNSSISDISSVVSMMDRTAGSAPGNGSRATVGEDLVAMTKCRLQATNYSAQDGLPGAKKLKRHRTSDVVSSCGNVNDSFWQLNGSEVSESESTATSSFKIPRPEVNHALVEEIRNINRQLIDTVVEISDEGVDPSDVASATEGGEGTTVKCSFTSVALSPSLKSQYASAQMSQIQPLRLLVPANYPDCSLILLDEFPVEVSKKYEDHSMKAKSRFGVFLRNFSQPMSLKDIAKTWDVCARSVISECAQQNGGGTFSSKYGSWENCLSTA
ncbi:PREDICTED: mediator of RNA polymerase II transcription subunit 15a-like [Nicotiana attenuata]|uniref:Mediator of rna polymerase ii transcription subunit 15a n=1 Tax=Nicotiana attenuata TaxID=49451 RepID=A0A314L344_NICAT|nr:PREDICTED: mediator of RNA polymerase II transcription subunit 15a-like [Nicotiana attenuata]OIT35983.1 mediator of rna polymerase ii transcription subunit 15a [Nicotiana attenuata]